jgi:hypothetical protein
MTIFVPYETSGQQLGETRTAMTKRLMKDLEQVIDKYKDKTEKYFVLVHGKPWPHNPNVIKIKLIPTNVKPPMMLSCLLFGVENQSGKLTLEWALPGDWPTWSVGGTNEPVPEVIASVTQSGVKYHYDDLLPN